MSDPQRLPDDHPRRAEPLQPDKPGSGGGRENDEHSASTDAGASKAREQEKTAIDNVREGYD